MRVDNERARWIAQHVLPHERRLRGWLGRQGVQDTEVDDLVQDIYARLATAKAVTHIRNSQAYLFQVARSVAADHWRSARVTRLHDTAAFQNADMADFSASPEVIIIARSELLRLARVVASFPERTRKVFVLRRVEGLTQREIANRLSVSESTVEKQIANGVRLLAQSYANDHADEAGFVVQMQDRARNVAGTKRRY